MKILTNAITIALILITTPVFADSAQLFNSANGHSYQRFDAHKKWSFAKDACASLSAHLATITSQAENDWLVSNRLNKGNPWLGGTDEVAEGIWAWITGEVWNYANWDNGQPDNYSGVEDHLQFWTNGGKWNDVKGGNGYGYICERDKNLPTEKVTPPVGVKAIGFTDKVSVNCENTTTGQTVQFSKKSNQFLDCKAAGLIINSGDAISIKTQSDTVAPFVTHQYQLNTTCGGWFACKTVAESLGGHLATITTVEEQTFLYNTFKGANFWIGLSDYITEGAFQWDSNGRLQYTYWNTKQPDNAGNSEDCTVVTSVGKWADMNCDNSFPALIEFE